MSTIVFLTCQRKPLYNFLTLYKPIKPSIQHHAYLAISISCNWNLPSWICSKLLYIRDSLDINSDPILYVHIFFFFTNTDHLLLSWSQADVSINNKSTNSIYNLGHFLVLFKRVMLLVTHDMVFHFLHLLLQMSRKFLVYILKHFLRVWSLSRFCLSESFHYLVRKKKLKKRIKKSKIRIKQTEWTFSISFDIPFLMKSIFKLSK